jgi:hypothetical protein
MKRMFTVMVMVMVMGIACAGFGQQIGITASIAPQPYLGGSELFIYLNTCEWWIGFDIRFFPFLAVKPGVLFFRTSNDQNQSSDMLIGASIDIDYLMDLAHGFALYVGPGFKFLKYLGTNSIGDNSDDITTMVFSVVVGGQYMLSKNFGFFGDVGISYIMKTDYQTEETESVIATRNAYLGVVFYFN